MGLHRPLCFGSAVSGAALDLRSFEESALDTPLSLLFETSPLTATDVADGSAAAAPWSEALPVTTAGLLDDSLFAFTSALVESIPPWSPE